MHKHSKHIRCSIWLLFWRYGIVVGMLTSMINTGHAQTNQLPSLHQSLAAQRDSTGYIDVLSQIGWWYYQSNTDSCLWYAIQVKEMSERQHYTKGIANAWGLQAICHAIRSNFKLAVEYQYHALQLYRSIGDSTSMALSLNHLAALYYNYAPQKEEDAFDYWYEGMIVARRLPPPTGDSVYATLLGNFLNLFADSPIARRDSLQWVVPALRQLIIQYPGLRSAYYLGAVKADSLMMARKGREAEMMINQLGEAAASRGFIMTAITMYEHMYKYRKMGYPTDTIHYWEKMYLMGKEAGFSNLQTGTLAQLYQYYSTRQDMAKIDFYTREIIQQANRLRKQYPHHGISYIDYFLKAGEQEAQQKDNQVQSEEIAQQDRSNGGYRLAVSGVILGAAILLLVALYKNKHLRENKLHEKQLTQKHEELSAIQLQLEANDDFKNKLITIIANDFRVPLLHISEVAQLLKNSKMSSAEMMATMEEVATSSRHTLTVFDNILRWIKSQLSGFEFVPQECMLDNMITAAIANIADMAAAKQVEIHSYVPGGMVVAADPDMLQFVHRHLLQAAIAASEVKRSISIMASQDTMGISVSTGVKATPGIKPETWFMLKEQELAADNNLPQQDMPLMLVICKDFMMKMKGKIWAVGKSDGTLTVYYCLPEFV